MIVNVPSASLHAVSASRTVWRMDSAARPGGAGNELGLAIPSYTSMRAIATGRRRRAEAIRASSATWK